MSDTSEFPGQSFDERQHPPQRRRMLRIAAALLALVLFALLAVPIVMLTGRPPTEFYGRPELLLPPETAAAARWARFADFLDRLEAEPAVQAMYADGAFAHAVQVLDGDDSDDEDLGIHYQALGRLTRGFVDRWLGREVTVALVPSGDDGPSAVLVVARTGEGFDEDFADLLLRCFPGLDVESLNYRGHAIRCFEKEAERRSFAYCRFGETVVVLVRSSRRELLEAVIDRKLDGSEKALASEDDFRASMQIVQDEFPGGFDDGLVVSFFPQRVIEALRRFPGKFAESPRWQFWFDYFDEGAGLCPWGVAWLRLAEGELALRAFVHQADDGRYRSSSDFGLIRHVVARLPEDCVAATALGSSNLPAAARDLHARMLSSDAYHDKTAKFEEDVKELTGLDLRADLVEKVRFGASAGLTGLTPGVLLPLPCAQGWLAMEDKGAALELARKLGGDENGRGGLLTKAGWLAWEPFWSDLTFALNGPVPIPAGKRFLANPPSVTSYEGGLSSNPFLAPLWNADDRVVTAPVLIAYVDFEKAWQDLERLRVASSLWSKKTRRRWAEWEGVMRALRSLDAMRLALGYAHGGWGAEAVLRTGRDSEAAPTASSAGTSGPSGAVTPE